MTFISETNKFIFIEPQKTATSSFNYLFRKEYKIKNLLRRGRGLAENNRHQFSKHIKDKFPDRWQKYTTFCIVRNPWHRYVSWFRYEIIEYSNLTFDEILGRNSQTDFIFDENIILVDKILKFENLQQEWDEFAPTLGLYPRKLPHKNNLGTYDYRDYYDDGLIDIVYKKEKKIIDMMGYTYD